MEGDSVGELLTLASQGDERAWATLVERFERVVWSVTHGFHLDDATRADVFQLTWLRLMDNLERIREPDRLAGWLATTARRECVAIHRAQKRRPTGELLVEPVSDRPDVDARLLKNEQLEAMAEAFLELDERCRVLLRLVVCDPPIGYEEIAGMLEMPVGAIGPTRARCLEKLRRRPAISRISEDSNASSTERGRTDV